MRWQGASAVPRRFEMAEEKKTGFIVACKQYFGFKHGQTLLEFKEEVKQLTDKDRADMIPGLEKELGIVIG
jgi:hypothetical protein